jgi:hypothetical protein
MSQRLVRLLDRLRLAMLRSAKLRVTSTASFTRGNDTMAYCIARTLVALVPLALAACTGPVEFSANANPPPAIESVNADFSGMDRAMDTCKASSRNAGPGRCAQVRAYEACMKTQGYITVLGPENPPNCGQPDWEQDVRRWLK